MEQEYKVKQTKKMTIFACILSVISIGFLVFGFYIVSSDKVIMMQSISNLTNKLSNFLDQDNELLNKINSKSQVGVKSNIHFSLNEALVQSDISGDFSVNYLEDKDLKQAKSDVTIKFNGQELLGVDCALNDNNIYFSIRDITPKYYYTALEFVSFSSSLNGDDYDKVINIFKKAINGYLDNKDIKKEKVKISVDGKDKKVNKLVYSISEKDAFNITKKFVSLLKQDKSLMEKFAKYASIDQKELEKQLDSINEVEDDFSTDEVIYYNVYYYGFNKIVRYEIEIEGVKLYYQTDKNDNFVVSYLDETVFEMIVSKNKEQYTFNGNIGNNSEDTIKFDGTATDNNFTVNVTVSGMTATLTYTSEDTNNDYLSKEHIKLSMMGMDILSLDLTNEYVFDEKVELNLKDSVNIENISQEDLMIIYNNFMNHPLYSIFESVSGMMEEVDFSNLEIGL